MLTEDASDKASPADISLKQPQWKNRVDALCDMALDKIVLEEKLAQANNEIQELEELVGSMPATQKSLL